MTEDELNVLRYFIFCAENQSAIEEKIVVNPILICWYFSIWIANISLTSNIKWILSSVY